MRPRSLLLCATPRTGSTLLCSLLTSTGVAGRPESFFRAQDQHYWARRLGAGHRPDGSIDYQALAFAAVRHGSTPNGVFAARVMWGSMEPLVTGLDPTGGTARDLDVLTASFGPLVLVHHTRGDVVGQAVSWARAQQSGFWQQGDHAQAQPRYDAQQIDRLVHDVADHNDAWRAWFSAQDVVPLETTYEELVAAPGAVVARICAGIGVEVPAAWRPESGVTRQARRGQRGLGTALHRLPGARSVSPHPWR